MTLDPRVRGPVVGTALTALVLALFAMGMTVGSAGIGAGQIASALLGTADPRTAQIVVDWRLPRVLFAAVGGAALGLSGAIFQFLTRNPLGSPDIIGFSAGAYTGALLITTLGGTGLWERPLGALAGGIGTGLLVYFLAWDRGISGLRVIVIGIAVSLFMGAINTYLLLTLGRDQAILAAGWGVGNLANIGWRHTVPLLVVFAVVTPAVAFLGPRMRLLELGDEAAQSLGLAVRATRSEMMLVGIVLVAIVTAAAGPIAFVALAAPQLAKRLGKRFSIPLYLTGVMGAALLLGSDIAARGIIPGGQLPVGVITLCVGGAYLLWLLAGKQKIRSGGEPS